MPLKINPGVWIEAGLIFLKNLQNLQIFYLILKQNAVFFTYL